VKPGEWIEWWYSFNRREIHNTAGDLLILGVFTTIMLFVLREMYKIYICAMVIK